MIIINIYYITILSKKLIKYFYFNNKKDVSIINEKKATSEQIEKARQFNLPDNFYLYEAKPECTGCRGCQNEE